MAEKSGRVLSIGVAKASKDPVKDGEGDGVPRKSGVLGVMGVAHWFHSSRKAGLSTVKGNWYKSDPAATDSTGEGGTMSTRGSQLNVCRGEEALSKEKDVKS